MEIQRLKDGSASVSVFASNEIQRLNLLTQQQAMEIQRLKDGSASVSVFASNEIQRLNLLTRQQAMEIQQLNLRVTVLTRQQGPIYMQDLVPANDFPFGSLATAQATHDPHFLETIGISQKAVIFPDPASCGGLIDSHPLCISSMFCNVKQLKLLLQKALPVHIPTSDVILFPLSDEHELNDEHELSGSDDHLLAMKIRLHTGYFFTSPFKESINRMLFGAPAEELDQMKQSISPQTLLFLVDKGGLSMHGVFVCDSTQPDMNIEKGAFVQNGQSCFPAHVRVRRALTLETKLTRRVVRGGAISTHQTRELLRMLGYFKKQILQPEATMKDANEENNEVETAEEGEQIEDQEHLLQANPVSTCEGQIATVTRRVPVPSRIDAHYRPPHQRNAESIMPVTEIDQLVEMLNKAETTSELQAAIGEANALSREKNFSLKRLKCYKHAVQRHKQGINRDKRAAAAVAAQVATRASTTSVIVSKVADRVLKQIARDLTRLAKLAAASAACAAINAASGAEKRCAGALQTVKSHPLESAKPQLEDAANLEELLPATTTMTWAAGADLQDFRPMDVHQNTGDTKQPPLFEASESEDEDDSYEETGRRSQELLAQQRELADAAVAANKHKLDEQLQGIRCELAIWAKETLGDRQTDLVLAHVTNDQIQMYMVMADHEAHQAITLLQRNCMSWLHASHNKGQEGHEGAHGEDENGSENDSEAVVDLIDDPIDTAAAQPSPEAIAGLQQKFGHAKFANADFEVLLKLCGGDEDTATKWLESEREEVSLMMKVDYKEKGKNNPHVFALTHRKQWHEKTNSKTLRVCSDEQEDMQLLIGQKHSWTSSFSSAPVVGTPATEGKYQAVCKLRVTMVRMEMCKEVLRMKQLEDKHVVAEKEAAASRVTSARVGLFKQSLGKLAVSNLSYERYVEHDKASRKIDSDKKLRKDNKKALVSGLQM
jgi:hypothetical protein